MVPGGGERVIEWEAVTRIGVWMKATEMGLDQTDAGSREVMAYIMAIGGAGKQEWRRWLGVNAGASNGTWPDGCHRVEGGDSVHHG